MSGMAISLSAATSLLRSWWLPLCHFVNKASRFTSFLRALSFLDLILPFYLDLLETSRSTLELLAFGARLA